MAEIVGIEEFSTVDFLQQLEHLPKSDEDLYTLGSSWQCGGKVATAIAAASRLGADAGIIGIVGDDSLGVFCKDDYDRHGVDTTYFKLDPGASTYFCVILADKETNGRCIIVNSGNHRIPDDSDIDMDYILGAKFLHLAKMNPVNINVVQKAREAGVTICFDADTYDEETYKNIHLIDVFIMSEFFYNAVFKSGELRENCEKLQTAGPSTVIVTLGKEGCAGVGPEGYFTTSAFSGFDIVDTTGAGDVFHGAYIVGMLHGWNTELCARFSCAVAGIKCTRSGGRAAIPDFQTVMDFLGDGNIDFTEIDERVEFYKRFPL
jgi:sulfofructose kinase